MKNDQDMDDPVTMSSTSAQTNTGRRRHKHEPSGRSIEAPPLLSSDPVPAGLKSQKNRPPSPVPSCVSMKSDQPPTKPLNFSSEQLHSDPTSQKNRPPSPVPSCVSMKSDQPPTKPLNFSSEQLHSDTTELRSDLTQDPSRCEVCERVLRDPVITTCGHSLCRHCISSYWKQPGLPGDQACPQCGKTCRTQPPLQPLLDEHTDMVESSRHLHTEHTPDRKNKLVDDVLRRVIEKHKASLKKRFENISEGIIKPGAETPLNKIYTELYIIEGESEGVNTEHEVWQVESASRAQTTKDTLINCNDIFKPLPGQEKNIRTVMTKGVAGIGKTVSVQKLILDWIDGIANQNVDLMFPLPFRELNLVRDDQYSLHKLLLDFHPELKELNDGEEYRDCQVVFIFDGLDESRISLNLQSKMLVSDVTQTSSMDVLMTSLIHGSLLPSARIWITSRPAAASQIPAQCIDQVTEVRGFNDLQKEEYFRKRISDERQAGRIISYIKASRSLHIMCHIPVFCWIAATVLQQMLEQDNTQEIPKTLTEMFVHFLLIQTTRKGQKYQSGIKTTQESQEEILPKLAKLAFIHLEKGNVMFYEEDLKECGIDVSEASVYSGMCTEIFKEETMFHQKKIYCFVHLSIQEFLAALHVFVSYSCLMKSIGTLICLEELLKNAVTEALKSRNGHFDLFLRFLMGICLESNQRLLGGLLNHTHQSSESIKKICQYIKVLNKEDLSPERCISLLQCLSEVNDHSIHEEIQEYPNSPKGFKKELSPAHCSALAHMLLMSEEVLDEFDLKTYNTSDEGHRRLIPALRCFRTAKLDGCKLNKMSCETVKRSLQSANSLIRLDLSCNALGDSGVQILSAGLTSPHCKLKTLRLTECTLTAKSCGIVETVLQSPNSLTELSMSNNVLGDSGVQLLSNGLSSPHCKLQTLRLAECTLRDKSCGIVATVLQSPNYLTELDLSNNVLGDSGVQLLSNGLSSPHFKLQTLRLAECTLSVQSCEIVATVLQSPNSLIELDLSNNDLGDFGVNFLVSGLSSPHCKLQILRLAECTLTEKFCEIVATVLQSPNSLTELDLSNNDLGDFGVNFLVSGLSSPHCKLQTLRLAECKLYDYSCENVAIVLQSPNSLRKLDLGNNDLEDSGIHALSKGLSSPHCKLQTLRLAKCTLREKSCGIVATVLQSPNSLTEMDLCNNDLGDSGIQLLSNGLSSHHCKLQTLRLYNCQISNEGYVCLALTLILNPSCVKELDVSNNHPGESAQKLLSSRLVDHHRNIEALQLAECTLTDKSCEIVATVLQSPNSLTELDLSNNDLGDLRFHLLSKGLSSTHCKLQTLRLAECTLTDKSCEIVATVLQSPNSLTELDLNNNVLEDCGVHLLSKGLASPYCKLQTLRLCNCQISNDGYVCLALTLMLNPSCVKELDMSNNHPGESTQKLLSSTLEDPHRKVEELQLTGCTLTDKSCGIVATVLQSSNSLTELDLSNNDLGDSGVQHLFKGLSSPQCKLQTLRLCNCRISNDGYVCLALTLMLNPYCVKELDVSNNHPGESAQKLLSSILKDPHHKVQALQLAECTLTDMSCEIVATFLQSPNSLTELDLSKNDLGDSGVQHLFKGLSSPQCNLHTLRLAECTLTDTSCEIVATVLQSPNSLTELDLGNNDLGDSGVQFISKGLSSHHSKMHSLRLHDCKLGVQSCLIVSIVLKSPNSLTELDLSNNDLRDSGIQCISKGLRSSHCKLQTLSFAECTLTHKSCGIVATVLQSPNSLIELDLSNNILGDYGVQHLFKGLSSPHCRLQTLRLAECILKDGSCAIVATVLQSPNSLTELDLGTNDLGDSGVQHLFTGLSSPHCRLQTLRLAECTLTDKSCGIVATVLQSPNYLTELDLGNNDLGDLGVQFISKGLSSPHCKMHTLRLSDCLISEKGCICLASTLSSNPSHLKELDLSYNYPGESGLKLLYVRLEDPDCKLERLKTDHAFGNRARPRLLRYACELTLDPNTAQRGLYLSKGNRKVTWETKEQPYPDHPERFDRLPQVLCREGLTGRCYWEAEWSGGGADITVAYKSIERKQRSKDSWLGCNDKSWSLVCSPDSYSAWHNNEDTDIPAPSSGSSTVGLYLDWPAGTLSFYSVSSDTLTHLHTFYSTFTEPLYPGFGVWGHDSSVSLCQITCPPYAAGTQESPTPIHTLV